VTSPEFLGPFFVNRRGYTDYYFICQLKLPVPAVPGIEYEVALLFDNKHDKKLPAKTATGTMSDVRWNRNEFGKHFGERVRLPAVSY